MKKSLLVAAVAISALFAGGAAMAQDEAGSVSYNIAVTSDYVWRGISQTDGDAALQGGIDYKKGIFYAGAWASNVDFGKDSTGDDAASTELDLYLGLTPTWGNYSFDFGAIAYTYPGQSKESDFNVGELKAGVSHPMGAGTIGASFYLPTKELEDPYYEINASYPLTDKFSISGAIGNWELEGANYTNANIGVTYAINDTLSLDVRATDASKGYDGEQHNYLLATLKAGF